jgi:hypothetical protein
LQPIDISVGSASISLTKAELIVLKNSLNEVLNGIHLSEFQTRLGVSREAAHELLTQIESLLDTMKRPG